MTSVPAAERLKVMTIVGTRPELIKLSRVIAELDIHTNHILVHTGQNYDFELNEIFFRDLGIRKPDHFLQAAGVNAAETIANVIVASDKVIREEKPEAVLLYGDTNSCLSVISAKRLKVPVFHMEAGNRCFDERVPEELNRRIVDHLSDVNLTLTEHARRYLLSEGLRPELTFSIGSSMPEVLRYAHSAIESSAVLAQLALSPASYILVSAHREENVDEDGRRRKLITALARIAEEFDRDVIISTHPRTRARLSEQELSISPRLRFMKPLGFFDYVRLQKDAFCVLSDSGTLTEESSLLGFPAVMIRDAHERPEGMDVGTTIMSGLNADRMIDAVRVVTAQQQGMLAGDAPPVSAPKDYGPVDVSRKVVRIILSYTDYINRKVWSKPDNA